MLQSLQHNLSDELSVAVGLMEDSQLLLGDSFSVMEALTNSTTVRQTQHTHTSVTRGDDSLHLCVFVYVCVRSCWRCSTVVWISGAPCCGDG